MTDRAVAIVTGAASGIGRATVERLMSCGTRVVAVDLTDPEIGDISLCGDITEEGVNRAMVDAAQQKLGGLDTVVLNAGLLVSGTVEELELKFFDQVMDVNVRGVVLGIRAAAPALRARGGGSIVVTSSITAFGGAHRLWGYATSKAAVLSVVRNSSVELAADRIRVNAVLPGPIRTPMIDNRPGGSAERFAQLVRNVPMGRFGEAHEVAAVIAFLASPEAGYVTGVALPVDGGVLATNPCYAPFS
ncbi:MAG TPA: SDR family oxidoreductase [Pseudonocardiaceae bacterium]|jgi:NAD(P)-dependent dehydrogenase (short-subunit alcohol dehydrogenase family)|nr:SDR family oxidoreductase [Pseudonocardiaceae bacterium]